MCLLPLSLFDADSSGNAGITCTPLCLSSVATRNLPTATCVYPQDSGLCGMIAASNIQSVSGYSQWSCASGGYTSTNPCSSPVWPGLGCSGGIVVSLSVFNLASGMIL